MLTATQFNPDVLSCLANLSSDEVFTPPKLANEILDLLPPNLLVNKNAKFLDPGCKSGVFLREIAKRLLKELKRDPRSSNADRSYLQEQLYGIGITELTALMARRTLYCSKTANGKYSICKFKNADGNILYQRIEHAWNNGRCSYCGASQEEYARDTHLETHAYQLIHTDEPNKDIQHEIRRHHRQSTVPVERWRLRQARADLSLVRRAGEETEATLSVDGHSCPLVRRWQGPR